MRTKAGIALTLRYVTTAGNPISERITQLTAAQLNAIGVGTEIVPVSSSDLFDQYITPGNFDLVGFAYAASPFPISGTRTNYVSGSESNVSRISTPEIDQLYERANAELDDAARTQLGQQIDRLLWEQVPVVPLYQSTGAYAVRSTLANFGAHGYADYDFVNMGFTG